MSDSFEVKHEASPRRAKLRGSAIVVALIASTVAPIIGANSAGAQTQWNGFAVSDLPTAFPRATPGWSLATTNDLGGGGLDVWQTNHFFESEALQDLGFGGPILQAQDLGEDGDTDSHGAVFADIDGDGDDDLFEVAGRTNDNSLFRNDNGTLVRIDAGNIADFDGRGRQPLFFDFDNDGDLDVFIANLDGNAVEVPQDQQAVSTSRIYLNNGNGTAWTEVADPNNAINDFNIPMASFTSLGPGTANNLVTHNVFNVALDSIQVNTGIPTPTPNGPRQVTDFDVPNRDVIVGDFDGDLFPEFVVFGGDAEVSPGTWPIRAFEVSPNGNARGVQIPRNGDLDNCRSGTSGDFDNDGDLDILAGCTQLQEGQTRNVLLLNDGFGNFSDAGTSALPATIAETATTVVTGDINGDGFLDAIVANGYSAEPAVDHVITNRGGDGNWIAFDLNGSNPGAIGAQLFVGSDEWQVRETGHAYHLSQDSRTLHFGLGAEDEIAPVLVQWPNGAREECTVTGINVVVSLSQGSSNCEPITSTTLLETLAADPDIAEDQFCRGQLVTVDISRGEVATSGRDVILGTSGADVINGFGGADLICALAGDDVIDGGFGNDTIFAGNGNDSIRGNRGNDTLRGENGFDTIEGGNGADNIRGNSGDDRIIGGNGADTVFGGTGNDTLIGSNGADRLFGGAGNDLLLGQNDSDVLNGGLGTDVIGGGNGVDNCGNGATIRTCELRLGEAP